MAETTVVRVKRDGQILLADSGAAHTYTVAYEPGDFNFTIPGETVNLFLDRGVIGSTPSIRYGDEQPMTLGFSAYMRGLGDPAAAYATLLDIGARAASGYVLSNWTSTMGSNSDVFTISVTFTIDGSPFGEADQSYVFAYVVFRANGKEGDPNTVDCTGTSYALKPVLS